MEVNNYAVNSNQAMTRQNSTPSNAAITRASTRRSADANTDMPEIRSNEATVQSAERTNAVRAAIAPQAEAEVTDAVIYHAVEEANRALAGTNFSLGYGVHEATNRITVRVYDDESGEIIRELPPESRLDTLAKVLEMSGLILDDRS